MSWGGLTFRKTFPGDTVWASGYELYLRKTATWSFSKRT